MTNPERRLNNFEVEERAKEAQSILDNPVFKEAMDQVYSRAVSELLAAEVGTLTAGAAHATMKSIMSIRGQLNDFITDDKMRQKYNKGDA